MKKFFSIVLILLILFLSSCNADNKKQSLKAAIQQHTHIPIESFFESIIHHENKSYCFNNKTDTFMTDFLKASNNFFVLEYADYEYTKNNIDISFYAFGEYIGVRINEKNQIEIKSDGTNNSIYKCNDIYKKIIHYLNPVLENQNKFYSISYLEETFMYEYNIYDKNGNTLENDQINKFPHITLQGDDIVCMWQQSGTGILTRSTYFYNINNGIKSPVYYGQTDSYNNLVSATHNSKVIIYDMFSGNTVREITKFNKPLANHTENISSAYFTEDGKQIKITYWSEDSTEVSQIIDL